MFPRDVTIAASRESKNLYKIMAIKVKAIERNVSFEKGQEKFAYVLQADLYGLLARHAPLKWWCPPFNVASQL